MLVEPKSSATILALADLADLSAKQLEEGRSIEEVIETLRAAAVAVRTVITPEDDDDQSDAEEEALDHGLRVVEAEEASDSESKDISA
ncbi:MAG: hypothetical protein HWE23_02855 [Rhodobacteraceae bacterium]|nr:hypothetical protein [Paracoccaceae bacterium]